MPYLGSVIFTMQTVTTPYFLDCILGKVPTWNSGKGGRMYIPRTWKGVGASDRPGPTHRPASGVPSRRPPPTLLLSMLYDFIDHWLTLLLRLLCMEDSIVAQMVKNLLAMQETWVWSLDQEDPQEKGMVTHSSILDWDIPWTEEPGGL